MWKQDGPLDLILFFRIAVTNCVEQTEKKMSLSCKHHQFYVSCLHRLNFPTLNVTISKRAHKTKWVMIERDLKAFEAISAMKFTFNILLSEFFSFLLPLDIIGRKGILDDNAKARTKWQENDTWSSSSKKKHQLHFRVVMFVFIWACLKCFAFISLSVFCIQCYEWI